jgi:hypothetical protein
MKTKNPFKDTKYLVGDTFRVFGVTRKNNLDEKRMTEDYTKCTFGFSSITEMMNLMKAMGTRAKDYEIFLPKNEGLLIAVSRDDDQVFVLAPRLDALVSTKK